MGCLLRPDADLAGLSVHRRQHIAPADVIHRQQHRKPQGVLHIRLHIHGLCLQHLPDRRRIGFLRLLPDAPFQDLIVQVRSFYPLSGNHGAVKGSHILRIEGLHAVQKKVVQLF